MCGSRGQRGAHPLLIAPRFRRKDRNVWKKVHMMSRKVNALGVQHVDQVPDTFPFVLGIEFFGVNVGGLFVGFAIHEFVLRPIKALLESCHRNTVRTVQVSHSRVTTSLTNSNHRLVVLQEL